MIFIDRSLGLPGERLLGLRTGEVHFASHEPPGRPGYDVIRYNQCGFCLPGAREYQTLLIRLDQVPEAIQAGFQDVTRYEIRRCSKGDAPVPEIFWRPDAAQMNEFLDFFAEFLADKALPNQAEILHFYRTTLGDYLRAAALVLSRIRAGQGNPLAWHTYLADGERARLVNSASLFRHIDNAKRNLVSRCNRYLHWHDMQEFRSHGYRLYDFGGLAGGGGDTISSFKGSFGGQPSLEFYDHLRALTVRGVLGLAFQRVVGHLRHVRNQSHVPEQATGNEDA